MIIHHVWDTEDVLPSQAIPKTTIQANIYAQMLELHGPTPNALRFSCLTTATLSRNILEIKRNNRQLNDHLYVSDTYMRQATLNTLDTVELGMLVALHPSLTNIAWRTKQLRQELGITEDKCPLQLYQRKFCKQQATTSCIVLRCEKKDAETINQKFLKLNTGALGPEVEFILYQMKAQMPNASFEGLYILQNEAIDNTGAISIAGIPEMIMTGPTTDRQQSLQQWIL